jgi:hypothetical protein
MRFGDLHIPRKGFGRYTGCPRQHQVHQIRSVGHECCECTVNVVSRCHSYIEHLESLERQRSQQCLNECDAPEQSGTSRYLPPSFLAFYPKPPRYITMPCQYCYCQAVDWLQHVKHESSRFLTVLTYICRGGSRSNRNCQRVPTTGRKGSALH